MHKKYTFRNGKLYGPYLYENKRVGDKIITHYLGKEDELKKPFSYKPFVIILSIVLLLAIFVLSTNKISFSPTGKSIMQVESSYRQGEYVTGNFSFSLRAGELIPTNSKIKINLANQSRELLVSELENIPSASGSYYFYGFELNSSGEGYGVAGQKGENQLISFQILITPGETIPETGGEVPIQNETNPISEENGTIPSETNQTEPGQSVEPQTDTTIPQTDTTIPQTDTTIPQTDTTIPQTDTLSESSTQASDTTQTQVSGTSMLTGAAIIESEQTIDGFVSKDKPFSYELGKGESASLVSGSVKVGDTFIDDGSISLSIVNGTVFVTTSYGAAESGFGEDFLGNNVINITVDITSKNILAEEGLLRIELVAEDEVLISKEENIFIVELGNESVLDVLNESLIIENNTLFTNLTQIKDIPVIRIGINGSFELNLNEYFALAERYEFNCSSITGEFNYNLLILRPLEGFKGSRQCKVTAFAGNESLESNLFRIIVSKGFSIKTEREGIVIGQPVKWTANVSLESIGTVIIELPKEAENISVRKIGKDIPIKRDEEDSSSQNSTYYDANETIIENNTDTINNNLSDITYNDSTEVISNDSIGEEINFSYIQGGPLTGQVIRENKEDKGFLAKFLIWIGQVFSGRLSGRVIEELNDSTINSSEVIEGSIEIVLAENATEYTIEYYTDAPLAREEVTRFGKRVVVSGPDNLNYTEVLSFTNVSEYYSIEEKNRIKLFWVENSSYVDFEAFDLDENGKIDYIEWITPHLSNQTFEIILIEKAEHLDENRTFIDDVYDYIKARDNNWTTIPQGHYLRIKFETNLSNERDITIYARGNLSSTIEVYELDSNLTIASFENVSEDKEYKIFLTNLTGTQDVFDLLVKNNYVDFDYIIDPLSSISFVVPTPSNRTSTLQSNFTIKVSSNGEGDHYTFVDFDKTLVGWWRMDDINSTRGVLDSSTYSNNGTNRSGASQSTTGRFNASFSFDGVNDQIIIKRKPEFEQRNISYSLWFRSNNPLNTSMTGSSYHFIDKCYGSDYQKGFYAGYGPNEDFGVGLKASMGNWDVFDGVSYNINLSADTWYHLAAIYNDSTIVLYLNGTKVASGTAYDALDNTVDLYIGSISPNCTYGRNFSGYVDEVMFFNRTLGTDEVKSLYNATANQYNHEFINLSTGPHIYRAYMTNTLGEKNQTEYRTFTTGDDIDAPAVNFTYPTPENGASQSANSIYVNLSTEDSNLHYSFVDFDNSLVLWMRMDDINSTGGILDLSNYRNNGTNVSTYQNISGKFNASFRFDATASDSINIADHPSLRSNSSITVALWVNNYDTTNWRDIIGKLVSTETTAISYGIRRGSNNSTRAYINIAGANNNLEVDNSTMFVTETWTHYAFSWNGSNFTTFRNGLVFRTNAGITGFINDSTGKSLKIGANLGYSPFNGGIDEVLIFNRSLSAKEIRSLYNSSANKYENNFTNLESETHRFKGYAVDTIGYKNQTEEREVTIGGTLISTCSVLDSPNTVYYIASAFAPTGSSSCLTVTGTNVTMDGGGYSLINTSFDEPVVYIKSNNVTVRNLYTRTNASAGAFPAVVFENSNYSYVINSSFVAQTTAIYLNNTFFTVIENVSINHSSSSGILLDRAKNASVRIVDFYNDSRGIDVEYAYNSSFREIKSFFVSYVNWWSYGDDLILENSLFNQSNNYGVYCISSNRNKIINVTFHNASEGVLVYYSCINLNVTKSLFESTDKAINIITNTNALNFSSINNVFRRVSPPSGVFKAYNIYISPGYNSNGVLLQNNSFIGFINEHFTMTNDMGLFDVRVVDTMLENVSISGIDRLKVVHTGEGEILFNRNVTGCNFTNFTKEVQIMNKFVSVNGSRGCINLPANVTLYNIPTNFVIPAIKKDMVPCSSPTCLNFTSLNAGTVIFNVTSWSNYTIDDLLNVTSCTTLNIANQIYRQRNNLHVSVDPCINITATNVTFDGMGNYINRSGAGLNAIYTSQNNITIINVNVINLTNTPESTDGNAIVFNNSNYSMIINSSLVGAYFGISIINSSQILIENCSVGFNYQENIWLMGINNSVVRGSLIYSSFSAGGGDGSGIKIGGGSSHNVIINNSIMSNLQDGIDMQEFGGVNNSAINNSIRSNNGNGINIGHNKSLVAWNNITGCGQGIQLKWGAGFNRIEFNNLSSNTNGILSTGAPMFNNFTTNTFLSNTKDINFGSGVANASYFLDNKIQPYTIALPTLLSFEERSLGIIKFILAANGSGTNLSNEIKIRYNFAYINETNVGLNKSANITFFGMTQHGANISIYRNGRVCPAGICYNFTRLDAGTVIINVSGGGNYSIQENPDITAPAINFTYPTIGNTTTINETSIYINVSSIDLNLQYTFVDFDKSLVLWLRMDDLNSSGGLLDLSSYRNNATPKSGAVYNGTEKMFNGSVTLYQQGSNKYLDIADHNSLDCTNDTTWSFWIYPLYNLSGRQTIIYKDFNNEYEIVRETPSGAFTFYNGDGAWESVSFGTNAVPDNAWSHVALVRNLSGKTVHFYINGVNLINSAFTKNPTPSTSKVVIGSRAGTSLFFNGSIDEFLIFNRSLSAQEITALYNSSQFFYYNNFTSIGQGVHLFKAYSVDSWGNKNETEQRLFWDDRFKPDVKFTSNTVAHGVTIFNNWTYINMTSNDSYDHYAFVDFDKTLILWMRMDDLNSSGSPLDKSRYRNNGSLKNDAYIAQEGKYSEAVYLDGVNDYINITHSSSTNFASLNDISVAFWVRGNNWTKTGTNANYLVSKANHGVAGFTSLIGGTTSLTSCSGSDLGKLVVFNGTDADYGTCTPFSLTEGRWYHVAFTNNGSKTFLYVNGSLIVNGNQVFNNAENYDIILGENSIISANFGLNGSIDEVIIFNRSLRDQEIKALYNASAYKYENNFTNLMAGNHTFIGFAVDTAGNINVTDNYVSTNFRQFVIIPDDLNPIMNFTAPTLPNNSQVETNNITINATISDQYLESIIFKWNDTNFTLYDGNTIFFYNFNNESSLVESESKIVDLSRYQNNGSVTKGGRNSIVAGKYGKAFNFNYSSYIEFNPYPSGQLINRNITIMFWINLTGNKQPGGIMDLNLDGASQYGFKIFYDNQTSKVVFATHYITGVNQAFSNHTLDLQNWTHVAVVYDYGSLNVKFYFNGENESWIPGPPVLSGTNTLDIGRMYDPGTNNYSIGYYYLNGSLDDVMFFNKTLSDAEVRMLYYTSIYKRNTTEWVATVNMSNMSYGTHNFKLFSYDLGGRMNYTEDRLLRYEQSSISSCQELSSANTIYTQSASINAGDNAPCISITAQNITYDCKGFNLNIGNTDTHNLGIQSNQSGTIIRNCIIDYVNDASPSDKGAVVLIDANNSYFYNNTVYVSSPNLLSYFLFRHGLLLNKTFNTIIENNTFSFHNYSLYLISSSNNIIRNNSFTNSYSSGIYLKLSNNNTLSNNRINNNPRYGLVLNSSLNNILFKNDLINNSDIGGQHWMPTLYLISSNYTNISKNIIFNNYWAGIELDGGSSYNNISGNNISSNLGGSFIGESVSAVIISGDENYLFSNIIRDNQQGGVSIFSGKSNRMTDDIMKNNSLLLDSIGLSIQGINSIILNVSVQDNGLVLTGDNNSIINSSINNTILSSALRVGSSSNNITNVIILNTNSSYSDLYFTAEGASGNYIIDSYIANYTFTGTGGTVFFKDINEGEIRFLRAINGSGTNLTNDIVIRNNYVFVNSTQKGLNFSANVTLFGLPTSYARPLIYRDGQICPSGQCYNFTSLNAGTVVFNVSAWSNYSILEFFDRDAPMINFTYPTPANGSTQYANAIYVNVSSNDSSDHYAFVDFDKSLVLWMRMDDFNSTGGILDLSSYRNNGTNVSTYQNISGKFNASFRFDATTTDTINIADHPSLRSNSSITVALWVNNYDTTNWRDIIGKLVSTETTTLSYGIRRGSNNSTRAYINIDGINQNLEVDNSTMFVTETWTHYAFSWNGSNFTTFRNGLVFRTNAGITGFLNDSTGKNLRIGAVQGYSAYNGSIDEVLIFNRSLSAVEIKTLYNANVDKYENNFTGLGSGVHRITGYAVDSFGNKNQTEERLINVDQTAPVVTIVRPQNTTYTGLPVAFNVSLNEAGNCSYSLDGGITNRTMQANASFTGFNATSNQSMINQGYVFLTYCNDSFGNLAGANANFSVEQTNIWMCNNLNTYNTVYTQNQSIIPTGLSGGTPCINITGQNITFNGKGYSITNLTSSFTAIRSNYFNSTIIDAVLRLNWSATSYGVYLQNSNFSSLFNVSISGAYYGVTEYSSDNLKIWRCNITNIYDYPIKISGDYFNITNNIISNTTSSGSGHGYGIDAQVSNHGYFVGNIFTELVAGSIIGKNNNTVLLNNLTNNGISASEPMYDLKMGSYSTISKNRIVSPDNGGISCEQNCTIDNNIVQGIHPGATNLYGITTGSNSIVINNTVAGGTNDGISLSGYNISIIGNNISFNQKSGVYISASSNVSLINNTITKNSFDDLVIERNSNASLVNNTIAAMATTNHFSINITNSSIVLTDNKIGMYIFRNVSMIIKKSGAGEISFFRNLSGNGNLTNDIVIGNNYVFVNSTQKGLNFSANVTLYGLSTSYVAPLILRDDAACPAGYCYNFTHLNAGTVVFNVSSWSNYSIGEGNVAGCTGTEYTGTGNWLIVDTTVCRDITILLSGNLTINNDANLTFSDNVTLILNSTSQGERIINNSGYFSITSSNLTALVPNATLNWQWHNWPISKLYIFGSNLSYFGYNDAAAPYKGQGIFINANNSIISGNNFFLNSTAQIDNLKGLYLYTVSNTTIANNTFTYADNRSSGTVYPYWSIIHLNGSSNNEIKANRINLFHRNLGESHAITLSLGGYNLIADNIVNATGAGSWYTHGIVVGYTGWLAPLQNKYTSTIGSSNNIFRGNIIRMNNVPGSVGMYIVSSNNITLENNSIGDTQGLGILSSSNITMKNNTLNASSLVLWVYGTTPAHYNHTIDITNFADEKPIYYSFNESDKVISNNNTLGLIMMHYSNNVTLIGVTLTKFGTSTHQSNFFKLVNSTMDGRGNAVDCVYCTNISILSNNLSSSTNIIFLEYTNNTLVDGNNLTAKGSSVSHIYALSSSYNTYSDNIMINNYADGYYISNNGGTLRLTYSNSSRIIDNLINRTSDYGKGLVFSYSFDNYVSNLNVSTTSNTIFCNALGFYYSSNNTIVDSSFYSKYGNSTVHEGNNGINYFLNVSFNSSRMAYTRGANGTLVVQWYLDTNVSSGGAPLSGANITGQINNGSWALSALTNANGFSRFNATQYVQNNTAIVNFNNYTINATKAGYNDYTNASVNISTNLLLHIVLTGNPPSDPIPIINSTTGTNRTLENLNCHSTISDPESSRLNVTVVWFNNSIPRFIDYYNLSYASGSFFIATLDDANTTKGENWTCAMRTFNGLSYSAWVNSSMNLTILNTPPSVILVSPPDVNATQNRTQTLNWSSTDDDGDTLTHYVNYTAFKLFGGASCTDSVFVSGVTNRDYYKTAVLKCLYDNGYQYNWTIMATDGSSNSSWATVRRFNMTAVLDISLPVNKIDFGRINYLAANNTTTGSPPPFIIRNDGNAFLNVSINATRLWLTQPGASDYYKFKVDNVTSELFSFFWRDSITAFTQLPLTAVTGASIAALNYSDTTDSAEIDLLVQVPPNEPAGLRNSTVYFTSSLGE